MKQNINYINALPDFLAMQRISFCWFITQGLNEELALFSRIHDFSQNTEYIMFGEEYNLIKPPYSLLIARKYSGNYRAQLVIPIEVRNKIINSVRYHNQFPIITLPLMTTYATFVINGCERVIVSQIIRSPGVYFEKNKNQRIRKQFKRKLSTDINKLRSFLPSGEAFISEFDLFFPIPTTTYDPVKNKKKIVPYWKSNSIYYYSLKYLKKTEKHSSFYFLQCFKFYRIISKVSAATLKNELITLFLKWLKLQNTLKKDTLIYLLKYFNFLLKLLIKYEIFQSNWVQKKLKDDKDIKNNKQWLAEFIKVNNISFPINNLTLSTDQIFKLYTLYDKEISNSQKVSHVQLNSQLLLITKYSQNWLIEMRNFAFLKQNIKQLIPKINNVNKLTEFQNLRPTIYFSISLKEQLKYIFGKNKLLYKSERHKYLKTKTQLLLYRKDHEIKTNYHHKYDEKDLYTATLIPEYGSWIRFTFQRNTKINSYKYPIKNQEDEVIIQLDKINQKPVLYLLKEMGLTDLEIYQNLEHSDFFYFTKPLLINSTQFNQPLPRFNLNYSKNISEFSRIFDSTYYRLGRVGRLKVNSRLNLKISERLQTITYEDIFAITDKLISLTVSKTVQDDIDHLKNRRVRSVGELLQNLFRIGFQRLVRKLRNQTNKIDSSHLLSFNVVNATVREFFGSSQLSQYLDQTNPLSSLTHRRRISGLGPGGFDRDRISFAVRDIHPSHYGRICPIETPEGQNVGLIASLTTGARVNKSGFLETPFWRVINGKVIKTGTPIYLTADIEDLYKIAPADIATNKENYLIKSVIPVRYKQDFINVTPSEVDFIAISPVQVVSVAASLIPFFEHDDANRSLMGSNMQRQSVPLILPQKPIVGTGLENQIAIDSGMTLNAHTSGIVNSVTATKIVVKDQNGKKLTYKLQKYLRSNQQTCINHRPIVWKGEKIKSGQILTDGPAITDSELSLGQNVLVGYMPWQGYNFEDAILISERLVYDDIFTSIHIERYKIEIDKNSETSEQTTKNIPNLSFKEVKHLNDDGIATVGTFVKPGDILVGKVISNNTSE
jgi:DNA-directed RNA polymerase beta subunit